MRARSAMLIVDPLQKSGVHRVLCGQTADAGVFPCRRFLP
ncbi:hypothetical protein NT01EI_2337 [Edwardsiella ictaluri 93-146]|uniref:Uncharacterized protein n=1 Tax=Edwardsiella ictaluri (strain 93-146) TaxID=634503 RepID=C5B8D8_EDWI9|nr:hypothetical protein NT01EI_2337 [Edwardsiella ictaluri 93-146]